jgi:hypothetical protein
MRSTMKLQWKNDTRAKVLSNLYEVDEKETAELQIYPTFVIFQEEIDTLWLFALFFELGLGWLLQFISSSNLKFQGRF